MKRFTTVLAAAAMASTFASVSLAPHVASALEIYNFSFDTTSVAFAYTDGYWTRDHTWHAWSGDTEAKNFRSRYAERFSDWPRTREKDLGWKGLCNIAERVKVNSKNPKDKQVKDPYEE